VGQVEVIQAGNTIDIHPDAGTTITPFIINHPAFAMLIGLAVFGALVAGIVVAVRRRQKPLALSNGTQWLVQTARSLLGWLCIVAGMILLPLPIPLGLILLVSGTLLIGRNSRLLRRAVVSLKLLLRRWARLRTPVIGPTGRWLLRVQRRVAAEYARRQRQRVAANVRTRQPS
jgi:uncharacterized membrane protein YczE